MRAAALAFGARAGLARRGWEIAAMLERHAPKLSAIYRFRDLMVQGHGFTVMPPVLAGTDRAFRPRPDGAQAAGARPRDPHRQARAHRERAAALARLPGPRLPEAALPAALLFPHDRRRPHPGGAGCARAGSGAPRLPTTSSRPTWSGSTGCSRDLVQWRRTNLAGMVSAPSIEAERLAVSGHERLMRIDETVARLGAPARFDLRTERWKPLPEGVAP